MSAVATEKWSGLTKGKSDNGPTAMRIWDVIGATSADDALNASGVAQINSVFDGGNPFLKARSVDARIVGLGFYEVSARYELGNWVEKNGSDPTLTAVSVLWNSVVIELPSDRDKDGNPKLNANGDPFDPPSNKTYVKHSLQVTKNFLFYDYARWKPYENTVNSDSITRTELNGHTVTFAPQIVKCNTIQPAGQYTNLDTFIPMVASFEIYEINESITTGYPHQCRLLNQGKSGFYGGSHKSGKFVHDGIGEVTTDVRLKSDGTPYDTTLKVWDGRAGGAPVAAASAPTGAIFENPTSNATWVVYQDYNAVAFSPLWTAFGI